MDIVKTLRAPATALALLVVSASAAAAQGPPGGPGGGALSLAVNPTDVIFSEPGITEFMDGWAYYSTVTVTVDGPPPAGWNLFLRSDAPDLGGYGKPVDDLFWRLDGTGTWNALSTDDQLVVSGTGPTDVVLHLRVRLAWSLDEPAQYGAGMTFTLQ